MSGRKAKRLRQQARVQAVKEVKSAQSVFINSLGFMERLKVAVRVLRRKF